MPDNFLETLDPLLKKSGDGAYNLFQLHGFLTGIAVAPQMVNPAVWMTRVFGPSGKMPEFQNPGDSERVVNAVMEFYHAVLDALDAGSFAPILPVREHEGGEVPDAVPWCRGFVDGILIWSGKWFKEKDADFARLLMPIMYFAEPSIFEAMKKEMTPVEIGHLEELWIDMIPKLVMAVQRYVKKDSGE